MYERDLDETRSQNCIQSPDTSELVCNIIQQNGIFNNTERTRLSTCQRQRWTWVET
jgi:hypothetical protein